MRHSVRALLMTAAGLLFFGGPMLATASAQDTVTATAGAAFSLSTCTAASGSPSYQPDGNDYKWVYVFHVAAGSSSCGAKLPITLALTTTPSSSLKYYFSGASVTGTSWGDTSPYVQNSGTKATNTDDITLSVNSLSVGLHTYTPTLTYDTCTPTGCSPPNYYVGGTTDTFSGNIEIDIYVDGYDTLDITAENSQAVSSPPCTGGGSATPTLFDTGTGGPYEWRYQYNVTAGDSVCDKIPITLQIDDTDSAGDDPGLARDTYSIKVACDTTYGTTSGYCDYVTLSSGADAVGLDDGGDSNTVYATLNTAALSEGDYSIFIAVTDNNSGSDDLNGTFQDCATFGCSGFDSNGYIHIQFHVTSPSSTSPKCFFSDGNFAGLLNCAGEPIENSSGVTFTIVPGGKGQGTIVSTNPGQFFYNMAWYNNTGNPQTIQFSIVASNNLASVGAKPVHAYAFTGDITDNLTDSQFNSQPGEGIPCGNPDITQGGSSCTISVPAGDTIWIVWHVSYSQIGNGTSGLPTGVCPNPSSTPTCSNTAKNNISAQGQLSYTTGTPPNTSTVTLTCTASACGYLKH